MLSSLELWMNLVLDVLCRPFICANVNGSLSMVVFSHRRLAIQTDENDALKEALSSTLKAKEEDLKYYQEMMDQTKKIFLQGLRQFRQNSAPS